MSSAEVKNGHTTNGHSQEKAAAPPKPQPKAAGQSNQKKEGALKSFKKLRVLSKRPLPTEMGDGSYRTVVNRPRLKEDLRRLKIKGEFCVPEVGVVLLMRDRPQDAA